MTSLSFFLHNVNILPNFVHHFLTPPVINSWHCLPSCCTHMHILPDFGSLWCLLLSIMIFSLSFFLHRNMCISCLILCIMSPLPLIFGFFIVFCWSTCAYPTWFCACIITWCRLSSNLSFFIAFPLLKHMCISCLILFIITVPPVINSWSSHCLASCTRTCAYPAWFCAS